MNNTIDHIFDPTEDPDDTIDHNNLPLRRDRIRTILAQIMNHRTFKTPRQVKLLNPPIPRSNPGLTYVKDGPGSSDSRTVWLDARIVHNPVFKYAIFKYRDDWRYRSRWSPFTRDNTGWHDLYPGVQRVGGVGLFNENEDADTEDEQYDSTLQLMQFADSESLSRFKLTSSYVPMHLILPLPPANTAAVFDDCDLAQYKGWLKLFKDTDFNETEIRGIMRTYTDFERMELAFLGDVRSLNNCYAAIGGQTYFAWLSYRLAKEYKESL